MKASYVSLLIGLLFTGCACWTTPHHVLYQHSTVSAILEGAYDGDMTIGNLKHHGDTGIGTFDALDGEMILIDNKCYQAKSDGSVTAVPDTARVPFASVIFFKPDIGLKSEESITLAQLQKILEEQVPSKNLFYAVRIDAQFSFIKVRSVPRQNKPYPRLVEVTKTQPVFEYRHIKGTIAGFRCPEYAGGINVPGYHFHFISDDRKAGGHLLECTLEKASIGIDISPEVHLTCPNTGGFNTVNQKSNNREELNQAEK